MAKRLNRFADNTNDSISMLYQQQSDSAAAEIKLSKKDITNCNESEYRKKRVSSKIQTESNEIELNDYTEEQGKINDGSLLKPVDDPFDIAGTSEHSVEKDTQNSNYEAQIEDDTIGELHGKTYRERLKKERRKKVLIKEIEMGIAIVGFFLVISIRMLPSTLNNRKDRKVDSKVIEQTYEFTDEEKTKILDCINDELASRYHDKYEKQDVSALHISGIKKECIVTNFLVPLTSASNSPTLVTEFKLTYDQETDSYKVYYYSILKSLDNSNIITSQAKTNSELSNTVQVDEDMTDISQVELTVTTSVTVYVNLENNGKVAVYARGDDGSIIEIGRYEGKGGFNNTVSLPSGHYILELYTTQDSGYHWTYSAS